MPRRTASKIGNDSDEIHDAENFQLKRDEINLNIGNSPELPHIITLDPRLKILIDSGASSSIMNPSIVNKLFPNYIFSHNSEISSVHKVTKGTRALTFPVLQELGDDTTITFLLALWHSTYDCLIGLKDLQKLEANVDCKNKIFSTSKFEINYFKNIPSKRKGMKMNHHQESAIHIRTSHMNSENKVVDALSRIEINYEEEDDDFLCSHKRPISPLSPTKS